MPTMADQGKISRNKCNKSLHNTACIVRWHCHHGKRIIARSDKQPSDGLTENLSSIAGRVGTCDCLERRACHKPQRPQVKSSVVVMYERAPWPSG